MRTAPPLRTAIAIACAALPFAASAANHDADTQAQLRKLAERLDRLETENRALRTQLEQAKSNPGTATATAPAVEQRLTALEAAQAQTEQSLATDRISENEPELVTRLKAVEFQTLSMQKQARQISAVEGISVSASLTGVVQQANASALAAPADGHNRANYRGDIAVTLPGGEMGDTEGRIFVQTRFGQGDGLAMRPTYTGTPNSTSFRVGSGAADDAQVIIAQAWYQLRTPLPLDGVKRDSRESLSLTFGKIDPFVFFDQNAIADDETTRFLNNVFVHNPLLDSGGDAGVDAYGFTPGVIASYDNMRNKGSEWNASLGVFGSGSASAFDGPLGQPFVIAQTSLNTRLNALPGHWRAYAWTNGRATELDGSTARHSGWGVSVDQRVSDSITAFARYGHQMSGAVRFDRALTGGVELAGDIWGRGADAVGFAAGVLRSSKAFEHSGATLDSDGDGAPDYAFAPGGQERDFELYYRWHIGANFSLTPDLQLIQNPGGDKNADSATLIGLRARVGF